MGELACADVQTSHKTTCFLKYPMIMSLNGTMIDKAYLRLFTECRNLIPILSIRGNIQIPGGGQEFMMFSGIL